MNKLLLSACVAAVPVGVAALPSTPADLGRDSASLMPASTLVYVELGGFSELCAQGLRHPFVDKLLGSPLGDLVRERSKMTPAVALGMLNLWAGRPVLPSLSRLTEDGLALGVELVDGESVVLLAARGDAQLWSEVVELAMGKVAEARQLPPARVVPPHTKIRGVDVWRLGDAGAFALDGGVFLASNSEAGLRRMLALGAAPDPAAAGLAGNEEFTRARSMRDAGSAPFAWSWLDVDGLERAASGDGLQGLRALATQPAPHFLLGPVIANLGSSRALVAELDLDGERIDLTLTGTGAGEGVSGELLPPLGARPPALPLAVAGETARGALYRDIAGVFRRRVELFPSEFQPSFAEATANLALFFGGDDIGDDVLPGLSPWLGLIVREARFDGRAVPDLPLPAAALIARVADPEALGPRLVTAFQTFVAILNVEAAQQARPAMMMELVPGDGTTITAARFPAPASGEGVDLRYNLVPACALVGDTFVLGTHVSLVEELVGQLKRGELADAGTACDHLALRGARLAEVVRANEEVLVMNAVLNEGKPEEQARGEVRGLAALAEVIETLELSAARAGDDALRLSLRISLTAAAAPEGDAR